MKAGIVKASLLARKDSLRAPDYLCPDVALEKSIGRLEKARQTIETSLANKKQELVDRQREEDLAIAREELTIIER